MAGKEKAKVKSDTLEAEEDWGPSYRLRAEPEQASPTRKRIEARAYELYLQRGRKGGHDLEDWLIAEKELKRR